MRQTFRQDEAEQILIEAVRRSAEQEIAPTVDLDVTREKLFEMADELGISSETLVAVVRDQEDNALQARVQHGTSDARRDFIRHRRVEFFAHLIGYVVFNALVVVAWSQLQPNEDFWPRWSILGWGILVAWHALALRQSRGREFDRELALWQVKRFRKRSEQAARRKRDAQRDALARSR